MKFTVTLFVALILNLLSHAQSLRGKVVYISANQEVKLKFRSPIDNYSFVNKPESNRFSIKLSGSRNIVVNSATSNAKPASFVITEGENTHLFILQYKNKLDASELVYDYSSKEKLLSESQKLARGIKGVPEKDRFVNYVTNTSDYTTSNAVNTNDTSALVREAVATAFIQTLEKESISTSAVNLPPVTQETIIKNQRINTIPQTGDIVTQPKTEQPRIQKPLTIPEAEEQPDKVTATPVSGPAIVTNQPKTQPVPPVTATNESKPQESKPGEPQYQPNTAYKPEGPLYRPLPDKKTKTVLDKSDDKNSFTITVTTSDKSSKKVQSIQSFSQNSAKTGSPASQQKTGFVEDAWAVRMRDSLRYEIAVQIADSFAWGAKNYSAALFWYDSALKIKPQASYPQKQIKAVKQMQTDNNQAAAKQKRNAVFSAAMEDYKKADRLRVERRFEEAYKGFNEFLRKVDTADVNLYAAHQRQYIYQAKDYVTRLQPHLPKPKPESVIAPVVQDTKRKKKKRS